MLNTTKSAADRSNWMLYGPYGRSGRLILDEALRRGHRPVLAGRDRAQLSGLRQETGLSTLHVPLENKTALRGALSDVRCVLLAAGPYQLTGPSMRSACLEAGCSYLDINGEIEDFVSALDCDAGARRVGVAIIAGVGYGVVFTECLAAHLAGRLPGATWLRLSLDTQTVGHSRGAALSRAATMAAGGREIREGALRKRALAFATWRAPRGDGQGTTFAAAPLAELVAVQRSTGIANIVAGIPLSRAAATVLRVAGPWVGRLLARLPRTSARIESEPTDAAIAAVRSRVWAEAGDESGRRAAAMLETGEGYRAAAAAAVRGVELQLRQSRTGAITPVQAFGAGFALLVPGTRIEEL